MRAGLAALGLAVLFSGGCLLAPSPEQLSTPLPVPRIEDRGAREQGIRRVLAWPMRNDSGADILPQGATTLLRVHREDRDRVAARVGAEILQSLDQALVEALRDIGLEIISRPRDFDEPELARIVADAGADALLTARITRWQHPPPPAPGGLIFLSGEVTLLVPESSVPLWRYRVRRYPLRPPPAGRQVDQARELFRLAGAELARTIAPLP